MAYLMLGALMILLSILFRVAAVFRLSIPLLYALIVPTLFHEWFEAHRVLGEGICYAMLAIVVVSWIVSFVKKIRSIIARRRENQISEEIFLARLREARENGESAPGGGYSVKVDDLWRDVD